eukprot:gb/GECH01010125.1/.p1 GENE.gb/GECH01010125.1/~~gb/GECH01010125.1/.p1  ORF type:complete len:3495 (+),score=610.83 gb/GECH01010125.1/:1-10485(+)
MKFSYSVEICLFTFFSLFFLLFVTRIDAAAINNISPSWGGVKGGTYLTIEGGPFSLSDSFEANKIYVGGKFCPLERFYSTGSKLVCVTPPNEPGRHQITILVEQKVLAHCVMDDGCRFEYIKGQTPNIESILPRVATPHSIIEVVATEIPNDKDEIRHMLIGPENCILNEHNEGVGRRRLYCEIPELSSGYYNASLNIEGHGNAFTKEVTYLNSRYQQYNFQVVPEISNISPKKGSLEGGTFVTITGKGFSRKSEKTMIEIDNVSCKVVKSSYNEITCMTEKPTNDIGNQNYYQGTRGLRKYRWNNIGGTGLHRLKNSPNFPDNPDQVEIMTGLFETERNTGYHFGEQMKGIFSPPVTGNYTFYFNSDDEGELYLSTDTSPGNKTLIASVPGHTKFHQWRRYSAQISEPVLLEKQQDYYMESIFKQGGGASQLSVAATIPSSIPRMDSLREVQEIITSTTIDREIQTIRLEGVQGGEFALFYIDGATNPLPYNISANQMNHELENLPSINSVHVNRKELLNGFEWEVRFNHFVPKDSPVFLIQTSRLQFAPTNSSSSVEKTQEQSQPLDGTFEIAYLNDTLTVPFDMHPHSLKLDLERLMEVPTDSLSVNGHGNFKEGYKWTITFKNLFGDIPNLEAFPLNLNGTDADVRVNELVQGTFDQFQVLNLDYFTTIEQTPQLRVWSNSINAVCLDSCDFEFTEISTPFASQISPQNGTLNTTFTIKGQGFSADANENSVNIGDSECLIIQVNETEIKCQGGQISGGENEVSVHVTNKGYAKSDLTVNGIVRVDKIYPLESGFGGGVTITIEGIGLNADNTLLVFDHNDICEPVLVTFDKLECIVPPVDELPPIPMNDTSSSTEDIDVTVYIDIDGIEYELEENFIYVFDETPLVYDVYPSIASAALENSVTITGDQFGSEKDKIEIQLDNYTFSPLSVSNNEIMFKTKPIPPGDYLVKVFKENIGLSFEEPTLHLELEVSDITPDHGSVFGGTVITIDGRGFSSINKNNRVFLRNVECQVIESSFSRIKFVSPKLIEGNYQVYVIVGDIESTCGSNCIYHSTIDSTPTVNAINPNSGFSNTQVLIQGSGLISNSGKTTVSLGNSPCQINEISRSLINCTTSLHTAGRTDLNIKVGNQGFADTRGVSFQYEFMIDSISSNSSSVYGGLPLTLYGEGFSTKNENNTINIGQNIECDVVSSSITGITCETRPTPSHKEIENLYVSASIHTEGSTLGQLCLWDTKTPCLFSYLESSTPLIDTITPTLVAENSIINITGEGFSSIPSENYVNIGPEKCVVLEVKNNKISCQVGRIEGGYHEVEVIVDNKGLAKQTGNMTVYSELSVTTFTPNNSSYGGGKFITISGIGFSENTDVEICNSPCQIITTSFDTIECEVGPLYNQFSEAQFNMSNIQPLRGEVFGNGLDDAKSYSQAFDQNDQTYVSCRSNSDCYLGIDIGQRSLVELVRIEFYPREDISQGRERMKNGIFEASNNKQDWTEVARINSTPAPGWNKIHLNNENQKYRYFRYRRVSDDHSDVAEIMFYGKILSNSPDGNCPIIVRNPSGIASLSGFSYLSSITPEIFDINPKNGTAAGSTTVTIEGSGFTQNSQVYIDQTPCSITEVTDDMIECVTGERSKITSKPEVQVYIPEKGQAINHDVSFTYIDRWSAQTTWGNSNPPREGESVYIPPGQTILLDVSPPKLVFIVIEGTLIFDDTDLNLEAEYIFIRQGKLQIGTEDEPYLNQAVITLHGSLDTSPEIPIYGAKGLFLRNGTLDIHGKPREPIWTVLSSNAHPENDFITLEQPVDWNNGDRIVIASSHHFMNQSEEAIVKSTSEDKMTVYLDRKLKYFHIGEITWLDYDFIDMRAEVGLLSRNIIFQGDETTLETRYGAHMMFHSQGDDSLKARLEYVELNRVGQAFQLGRYPLHFHLIGDVHQSYVRGCSIHHTFNRALAVHGIHHLLIENNFAYNVMGHTFFIEDGIETKNQFIHNLGMLTRKSTSLLNTDTSPSTFWITNPDNVFKDNAAAGSENYGFWFFPEEHPTGASATPFVCPLHMPLGEFRNNRAHSNGRYGLRIFRRWEPLQNPCSRRGPDAPASLYDFTSFLNGRNGAIATRIGDISFINFKVADNIEAGIGVSEIFTSEGPPTIDSSLIIGNSFTTDTRVHGTRGIWTPRTENFFVKNITFRNFFEDYSTDPLESCSKCDVGPVKNQGGYTTYFEGLSFFNCTRRIRWGWPYKEIYHDNDGTLTGIPHASAINDWDYLRSDKCIYNESLSGLVCPSEVPIRRAALHRMRPGSLRWKDIIVKTIWGESRISYQDKSNPKHGWVFLMHDSQVHNVFVDHWVDWDQFDMWFNLMTESDQFYLDFNYTGYRDHFDVIANGATVPNVTDPGLPDPTEEYGTHFHNETSQDLFILVKGEDDIPRRQNLRVIANRCPDEGCPTPNPEPSKNITANWSDPSAWRSGKVPVEGDDVVIEKGKTIMLDVQPAKLNTLTIQGALEFIDSFNVTLETTYIFLKGGDIRIGKSNQPFHHNAEIKLNGDRNTFPLLINNDLNLGPKVLAIFGNAELYGKPRNRVWTYLAETASQGSNSIVLEGDMDWMQGEEIIISTSKSRIDDSEKATIKSVSSNNGITNIELVEPLKHEHWGEIEAIAGRTLEMRSHVGLLTRNVRITGNEAGEFGCHVFQGDFTDPFTNEHHIGTTKMNYVEFNRCAQYDSERSSFVAENARAGSISNSAFNYNFDSAVTLSNVQGFTLNNNVIYRTVTSSVQVIDSSNQNHILNNLAITALKQEITHQKQEVILANFQIFDRQNVHGNIAVGSEDMGFIIQGDDCDASTLRFTNNVAYASLMGVFVWTQNEQLDCQKIADVTVFNVRDLGIFGIQESNIIIQNTIVSDTKKGIVLIHAGDVSPKNQFVIKDSLIIGESNYNSDPEDCFTRSGILAPSFIEGMKSLPPKPSSLPWEEAKSDPTVYGATYIRNNTFANWNDAVFCGTTGSRIITSNPNSPDVTQPVYISESNFINVEHNAKVFLYDPDPAWRNFEDCGDMDCDGLKHVILTDKDGTFENGKTIISDNPGIANPDRCSLNSEWNAYTCGDVVYEMFVIESRDADTMTRRIAPVNVSTDDRSVLMNGPMDHVWDLDYTGQLRLSTFWVAAEMGLKYNIEFASTIPRTMRYYLLNAANSQKILATVKYRNPERLEVYVDNQKIPAKTSMISLSDNHGDNYYNYRHRELSFILQGSNMIEVRTIPVIHVSMRMALTMEEFFEDQFVNNLANSLGINMETIKVVDIRSGSVIVDFEIEEQEEEEEEDLSSQSGFNETSSEYSGESSESESKQAPKMTLEDISSKLTEQLKNRTINVGYQVLEAEISVSKPPPPPPDFSNSTDSNSEPQDGNDNEGGIIIIVDSESSDESTVSNSESSGSNSEAAEDNVQNRDDNNDGTALVGIVVGSVGGVILAVAMVSLVAVVIVKRKNIQRNCIRRFDSIVVSPEEERSSPRIAWDRRERSESNS